MPGTRRAPRSATIATSREAPGSKRREVPDGMSRRNPCAAARSKSRAAFASGRCRCDPIWIGRSPVFTMTSVPRYAAVRSALMVTEPCATRIAPGPDVWMPATRGLLRDRSVDGDELAPVRKGGLDLDVGEHVSDIGHHLVAAEHTASGVHEFGDRRAVTRPLDHPRRQQRDRL